MSISSVCLQVLHGQVLFDQQQQQQVAALFDVRAAMHERVYQEPQGKAADLMITDALLLAEPERDIMGRAGIDG